MEIAYRQLIDRARLGVITFGGVALFAVVAGLFRLPMDIRSRFDATVVVTFTITLAIIVASILWAPEALRELLVGGSFPLRDVGIGVSVGLLAAGLRYLIYMLLVAPPLVQPASLADFALALLGACSATLVLLAWAFTRLRQWLGSAVAACGVTLLSALAYSSRSWQEGIAHLSFIAIAAMRAYSVSLTACYVAVLVFSLTTFHWQARV